ncbi:MAG: hypothetical protein ACRCZ2_13345 [Fusobacteriaceae bacterium]
MSEAKRPAKKVYTTPVGVVGAYPYLQKPDKGNENFPKPRGEWSCKLAIPADKAQKLINMLEAASEANFKRYNEVDFPKQVAEAKAKGKKPPRKFTETNDFFYEDGEGNCVFTFKGHASWEDKKAGEVKPIDLRVYDSKGARIMQVPRINKDSEGRVEFSIVAYNSAVAGVGLKLQISKFQLLKLVEFSGGGNDTFGSDFEDEYEGEGYVADQMTARGMDEEDDEYNEPAAPADEYPDF